MKLNTSSLRYLTNDDWRVLAAVEQGSKNHEVVPTPLIQNIAGLKGGGAGVNRCISTLAKAGLVAKVKNARYDGYRLTSGGNDYLALNTHRRTQPPTIYSLGNQIGVGKESDIYITSSAPPHARLLVLKLHRLGRTSFRSVKSKRDYLRNRTTGSWMYLSRLAAQKEYEVMKVLWREGFAVPEPVAWSRHTVVMEFVDAFPLRMVESVEGSMVGGLYAELMDVIVRLARRGLIHGDFNEFNILIKEETTSSNGEAVRLQPVIIDFPQTVSTNHPDAEMYFDRDVGCIKRYFERRFKYVSDERGPFFADAIKGIDSEMRLDIEVEASGFSKKMAKELGRYVEVTGGDDKAEEEERGEEESGEEEDEDGDEVVVGDDAYEIPEDPQVDDPALAEQLGVLAIDEDYAVKPARLADYGLMPLEVPEQREVAEQVHKKKKAAGWAI